MKEDRYERRRRELQERIESMPEIPEEFLDWSRKEVTNKHYLFYKRKGNKVEAWCSACGNENEYRINPGESYEELTAVRTGPKPKHNDFAVCGICGEAGKWIAVGRKNRIEDKEPCYLWQTINEKTFVIRYFYAYKTATQGGEKCEWTEIARNFIRKGRKKIQKDYQKYDGYTGEDFWDDCNLYGLKSIKQEDGKIYPGSWDELKKSHLKYSGLEEYVAWMKKSKPMRKIDYTGYLGQYNRFPAEEMLVKMGLYELVDLCSKDWFDEKAEKPEDVLKIDKRKLKELLKVGIAEQYKWLKMYQMEKRLGILLKEEEEKELFKIMGEYRLTEYEKIAPYLSVTKFINRVKRYACKPDREHRNWSEYMIATRYCDYLDMCIQMGYDMTDTIKLFPKDLHAAHDKMVLEVNRRAADMRKQEVNKKYPNIAKKYEELEKYYGIETKKYIVRPVRDAAEMVEEGRMQHHCVGGDTYLGKHNKGESRILLMRKREKPEEPYITIEIRGTQIIQWYGEHDKKTDQKQVDAFLKRYVKQLEKKKQRKTA